MNIENQENTEAMQRYRYLPSLLSGPQPVPPQALIIAVAGTVNRNTVVTNPERMTPRSAHGHFGLGTEVYPPWLFETPPASIPGWPGPGIRRLRLNVVHRHRRGKRRKGQTNE
jgi:hypothetical protein